MPSKKGSRSEPTQRHLKTSDIHMFVDISPESIREYNQTVWPQINEPQSNHPEEFGRLPRQPSFIDSAMLDQFPSPPTSHASQHHRYPPPITYDFPSIAADDLLPPNPYFERLERAQDLTRQAQTVHPRRQATVPRTSSTASYSRPTPSAYPDVTSSHRDGGGSSASNPARYGTSHNNGSSISLGPSARLREGPAQRSVVRQISTPLIQPQRPYKASSTASRHVPAVPPLPTVRVPHNARTRHPSCPVGHF